MFAVGVAPRGDVATCTAPPSQHAKMQGWTYADMGRWCKLYGPGKEEQAKPIPGKVLGDPIHISLDMDNMTIVFSGTGGEVLGTLEGVVGDQLVPVVGISCRHDFPAAMTLVEYSEDVPPLVFTLHIGPSETADSLNVAFTNLGGLTILDFAVLKWSPLREIR